MFKKSLSLVLVLLMIASCMSTMMFTASAAGTPEGTALNQANWSTIKNNMSGKYYLEEDITVTEQIAGSFTGTLDGNGHTITTSVAIFQQIGNGATVKNLTFEGNITLDYYGGALAALAGVRKQDSNVTLENVINKADIVQTNTTGVATGGLIGYLYGAITAIGCENYGDITINEQVTHRYHIAGGLVGKTADGVPTMATLYKDCVNEGNISISTSNEYIIIGGIVGQLWLTNKTTFASCENKGNLTSTPKANITMYVGGIAGRQTTGNYTYIECKNSGAINVASALNAGKVSVGGLASGDAIITVKAYACVNSGNISLTNATGDARAAGFASVCADNSKFVLCRNEGTVSGPDGNTFDITSAGEISNYTAGETDVSFKGVQRSVEVKNGKYALRFVSEITNTSKYTNTGVVIYYMDAEKNAKYTNQFTGTVYAQINASSNGVNESFPTTATAGKYYSALTVTDIPATGTYEFVVIPYTTDIEGNCVYADAYKVTFTNGTLSDPVAYN